MKSTDDDTTTFSIGEVAQRFDLPPNVLRHWESVGLLAPQRIVADRRRYRSDDLFRVAVILRAKDAGFGLEAIREMISATNSDERTALLQRQRAELTTRIAAAQASLDMIDAALTCDHEDFTRCPHFRQAIRDRVAGQRHPSCPAPALERGAASPRG